MSPRRHSTSSVCWRWQATQKTTLAAMRKRSRGSGVQSTQIRTSQHPIFILQLHSRILGRLEEAWAAARAGFALAPNFTIATYLAANKFSDSPAHFAWRERQADGLRKAGLPEVVKQLESSLWERVPCSLLVDWPVYPRLRRTMRDLVVLPQSGATTRRAGLTQMGMRGLTVVCRRWGAPDGGSSEQFRPSSLGNRAPSASEPLGKRRLTGVRARNYGRDHARPTVAYSR